MKSKMTNFILPLAVASLTTLSFSSSSALSQNFSNQTQVNSIERQGESYYCDEQTFEHPTIVFRSDLGNARLIQFQREGNEKWYDNNPKYTPLNRCREIASRAREFDEKGIISYLTKEWMKDQKVWAICISKIDADHLQLLDTDPDFVRLLITLKPEDDPDEILNKIKGISSLFNSGDPLVH